MIPTPPLPYQSSMDYLGDGWDGDAEMSVFYYQQELSFEKDRKGEVNEQILEENENLELMINYIFVKSFMEKVKKQLKRLCNGCHEDSPHSPTKDICIDQADKDPNVSDPYVAYLHHVSQEDHDCSHDIWCIHKDVWGSLDLTRLAIIFEQSIKVLYDDDAIGVHLDFIKEHYGMWDVYDGDKMRHYLVNVITDRPQIAEAVKQALKDLAFDAMV